MQTRALAAAVLALIGLSAQAQTTVAGFTPGSFRVTEVGAAEYRIPIQVPPGIAGMEPKLALVYNSQVGNGLLGVGWSLEGLSAITRCPRTVAQDGVRGGVNYDWNDRYCLDGQRLVAISGSYGADGTEYRTERESFTKVISYGTAGNGPAWFKAWTKSGQILEYANTADSRIEAQGKTSVRVWALNKVSDTKGNFFTVAYTEDNPNGDYYPSRIDYTGNIAASSSPNASVRFAYQSRPDSTARYLGGAITRNLGRLTNVHGFLAENLMVDYRLSYETAAGTGRSRLVSVAECSGAGACLPATNASWRSESGGINASTNNATQLWWDDWRDKYQIFPGDFNGDGVTDIWMTGFNGTFFCPGKGITTGWNCTQVWWDDWRTKYQIHTGDFNGDGVTDIWMTGFNGGFFCPGPAITVGTNCTQFWWDDWRDKYQIYTGDFNGDGVTDIWMTGFNGTFFCPGIGITAGWNCTQVWWDDWRTKYQIHTGDFNGDGITDIWMTGFNGAFFCPGPGIAVGTSCNQVSTDDWRPLYEIFTGDFNGDGVLDIWMTGFNGSFFCPGPGITVGWNCTQVWWDDWRTKYQIHTGDFNGDGITDIWMTGFNGAFFCPGPAITVGTNCTQVWWDDWRDKYQIFTGDFDGDGVTDLWMTGFNGAFFAAGGTRPDLVGAVTTGLGTVISISYKPLTDLAVYTKEGGAIYPAVDFEAPVYVVSSHSTADGTGAARTVTSTYGGAKVQLQGRGFLGFRWTEAKEVSTGLKIRTEYRQDWPYTGMPSLVRKSQGPGPVLSQVTNSFGCIDPTVGAGCNITAGNRYFTFVSQSVETGNDLNAASLPTATTTTQYDGYGNATAVTVTTGDGYSKVTSNVFTNDVPNWLLGRLTRSSVSSTAP